MLKVRIVPSDAHIAVVPVHARHAATGITRAGQRQALAKRHRPAIDLQMGTRVVFEESDNELRAIAAAIGLERLRRRRRRTGRREK